jgi:hypothetical protein
MKEITLKLTHKELGELVRVVYLGAHVLGAYRPGRYTHINEKVEQTVYRAAHEGGLKKTVEYEPIMKSYSIDSRTEEELHRGVIDEYQVDNMFLGLSYMMAKRKLAKKYGAAPGADEEYGQFTETDEVANGYYERLRRKFPEILDAAIEILDSPLRFERKR